MKTLGFIEWETWQEQQQQEYYKRFNEKEEVFAYAPHYEKLEANAEKLVLFHARI